MITLANQQLSGPIDSLIDPFPYAMANVVNVSATIGVVPAMALTPNVDWQLSATINTIPGLTATSATDYNLSATVNAVPAMTAAASGVVIEVSATFDAIMGVTVTEETSATWTLQADETTNWTIQ